MTQNNVFERLSGFYRGKRVLVTGHTGFKGSWLSAWLARLGADVYALALAPDQGPDALFERACVSGIVTSRIGDIRDLDAVRAVFAEARPEIVFHLAARALVQQGYDDPPGTFAVNVTGTANVLEAARHCDATTTVVCVTTDKVYANREWVWGYREIDEIGGYDPYSASKAGAELVARAYRHALAPKDRRLRIATARGGNVIGGGDWSPHRLVPDLVRAIRAGAPLKLRHPQATRPWQHVLDLCYGYLLLGERLAQGDDMDGDERSCWNFGPSALAEAPVSLLVTRFLEAWGAPDYPVERYVSEAYEAMILRLDASHAERVLGWRPGLLIEDTIAWTSEWYRAYIADPAKAAWLIQNDVARFETILQARTLDGALSTRPREHHQ